jgi:transcriptional regulator with XRE-family HTH domain
VATNKQVLAKTIRAARLSARLTQEELGSRVGLKARGVSRWELGSSVPSRARRKLMVAAIQVVAPNAAATLAQAFATYEAERGRRRGKTPAAAVVAPPPPAPPPVDPRAVLERTIFLAADELDLPARRVRGAFARAFQRLAQNGLTLAQVTTELAAWRASTNG